MTFQNAIGVALDHTSENANQSGAKPSIDLLSRAMFRDVIETAQHHMLHKDMFQSLVMDGMPMELPDYVEPLDIHSGPSDVSVVETFLASPADQFAAIVGESEEVNPFLMETDNGENNVEAMIRSLLRSL